MRARPVVAIALFAMATIALLPGATGLYLQHRYQTLLEALTDAGYGVSSSDYRLGWLSSTVTTELGPGGSTGEPNAGQARLRVRLRLEHGPAVWFGGDANLDPGPDWRVLATATGRAWVVGGARPLPPLRVAAILGLLGELSANLTLPDLTYSGEAGQLHFVSAGAEVSAVGHGQWRLEGGIESLEARGQDGRQLLVSGIGLVLADAEPTAVLPLSQLSARIGRLSLDAGDTTPALSLAGLGLDLGAREQGASVALRLQAETESLDIAGQTYAPSRLVASLDRLDGAALAALRSQLGALDRRSSTPSQQGLSTVRVLAARLPELLSASPRLELEQLEVMTPYGTLSATADLRLRSIGNMPTDALADLPAPDPVIADAMPGEPSALLHGLVRGLRGSMQVSLSQSLLVALITQQQAARVRRELALRGEPHETLPPALAAEVDAAAQSAAAMLLRDGWLTAHQGRLVAEFRVGDAGLQVNDRSVAVPGWFAPPVVAR